jgi:hypothetical protein
VRYIFAICFAMVFGSLLGSLFRPFVGPLQQPRTAEEEHVAINDEQAPLLDEDREQETTVQTDPLHPVPVRVAPAPSSNHDTASPASLFVELYGGRTSIVLRCPDSSALADQFMFELNGQVVDRVVSKIEDGVSLVEFSSETGGRLKVFSGLR